MLDNTLKSVMKAEEQAATVLQNAEETAGELIEKAKKDAADLKAETLGSYKEKLLELEKSMKTVGEEKRASAQKEIQQEISRLKETAESKECEAIEAVIAQLI